MDPLALYAQQSSFNPMAAYADGAKLAASMQEIQMRQQQQVFQNLMAGAQMKMQKDQLAQRERLAQQQQELGIFNAQTNRMNAETNAMSAGALAQLRLQQPGTFEPYSVDVDGVRMIATPNSRGGVSYQMAPTGRAADSEPLLTPGDYAPGELPQLQQPQAPAQPMMGPQASTGTSFDGGPNPLLPPIQGEQQMASVNGLPAMGPNPTIGQLEQAIQSPTIPPFSPPSADIAPVGPTTPQERSFNRWSGTMDNPSGRVMPDGKTREEYAVTSSGEKVYRQQEMGKNPTEWKRWDIMPETRIDFADPQKAVDTLLDMQTVADVVGQKMSGFEVSPTGELTPKFVEKDSVSGIGRWMASLPTDTAKDMTTVLASVRSPSEMEIMEVAGVETPEDLTPDQRREAKQALQLKNAGLFVSQYNFMRQGDEDFKPITVEEVLKGQGIEMEQPKSSGDRTIPDAVPTLKDVLAPERKKAATRQEEELRQINEAWTAQKEALGKRINAIYPNNGGVVDNKQIQVAKQILQGSVADTNEGSIAFGPMGRDISSTRWDELVANQLGIKIDGKAFSEPANRRWGSQTVTNRELMKAWAQETLFRAGLVDKKGKAIQRRVVEGNSRKLQDGTTAVLKNPPVQ